MTNLRALQHRKTRHCGISTSDKINASHLQLMFIRRYLVVLPLIDNAEILAQVSFEYFCIKLLTVIVYQHCSIQFSMW